MCIQLYFTRRQLQLNCVSLVEEMYCLHLHMHKIDQKQLELTSKSVIQEPDKCNMCYFASKLCRCYQSALITVKKIVSIVAYEHLKVSNNRQSMCNTDLHINLSSADDNSEFLCVVFNG